jgi:hypothetical protein
VPKGKSYTTSGYDAGAARAQREAESRAAFKAGQPKSSYTDTKGNTRTITPADRRADQIRNTITYDHYYSRPTRIQIFHNYGPLPGWPVVYYSDPYYGSFWWWLLAQPLDVRAYWAYNHYDYMDRLRYRDLLAHDAALEARVRQLEAQRVPRDPTYTPPGIDPDLMYSDEYVAAAVNPTTAPPSAVVVEQHGGFWRGAFHALLILGIVGLLIWLIFIKRWGG